MSTVVDMRAANVEVTLPSGQTRTVNMIRLLVLTQNAEFKAKHGIFLPGVGKQHPTVRALREEFEIPESICRTWAQAAVLLRGFYNDLSEAIAEARS